jgi:hypothetical protein
MTNVCVEWGSPAEGERTEATNTVCVLCLRIVVIMCYTVTPCVVT